MPAGRVCEIDDPPDLLVAESLLREQLKTSNITRIPKPVDALALDFDGVLTDNKVMVLENGQEAVLCSRSDGWGIGRLRAAGVPVVVVSTENNPVVAARCKKLQIDCLQGLNDKATALQGWADERQVNLDKTIFVGNDINDIECLQLVGCSVVVADAHPSVRSSAKIILQSRGGDDAVREVCEMILHNMKV
jgi:N-acylneuraminate cytidylyltransferase